VWSGFKYLREECNLTQFAGTEPITDMVTLLNDAFDVLNGTCPQESINNGNFDDKTAVCQYRYS
jgi:hypothetical protein